MRPNQKEIIRDLGVRQDIDPTEEIEQRSRYLAEYLGNSGLKGFVLGISCGQDSLLSALLAKRATEFRQRD